MKQQVRPGAGELRSYASKCGTWIAYLIGRQ